MAPIDPAVLDLRVGVDCGFIYYAEGGLADPAALAWMPSPRTR